MARERSRLGEVAGRHPVLLGGLPAFMVMNRVVGRALHPVGPRLARGQNVHFARMLGREGRRAGAAFGGQTPRAARKAAKLGKAGRVGRAVQHWAYRSPRGRVAAMAALAAGGAYGIIKGTQLGYRRAKHGKWMWKKPKRAA